MNIDAAQLEIAFSLVNDGLKKQDLPAHMKRRWARATEKAKERLVEQPYFAWQPERLLIVSVPKEKMKKSGCRFYEANELACRRVDKSGLCEAFFEGFQIVDVAREHYRALPVRRSGLKAALYRYGFRPVYNCLPTALAQRWAYKYSVTALKR